MKIRHRLVFNKKSISSKFLSFLKEKKADFTDDGTDLVVVYILEEDEWKDELYQFLQKEEIPSDVECIYSRKEVEQSTWFAIRSKYRWGYPQPEEFFNYKNSTYDSKNYCDICGCGLKQKEEFRINKYPKWGKRNFLMLNWVQDELFISNTVKDILVNAGIKGCRIFDVINYRTNKPIEDIKQIYVEEILQPGLSNEKQSIKEVLRCKKCGSVKYIYSGKGFTYKKEIFESLNTDIVKTAEMFGDGHMCARLILVSSNLRRHLILNSLDKDLVFQPITIE